MNRLVLLAMLLLFAVGAATAAEPPASEALAALESKLHGTWRGGPCVGDLRFNADGTYERRHYSPANISSTGTWSLRWDALPPTLTLKCKTSDEPSDVDQAFQYRLTELQDTTIAILREKARRPLVYGRVIDER